MPQWAGSCWYYLRYMDPHNTQAPFDPEKERYWGPVDLYIGGVEHAVLHLLYARFWHKVLFDCGLVHTREPFQRLFNQGMILAFSYRDASGRYYRPDQAEERDGSWFVKGTDTALDTQIEKMSKSRYNVVNPDDIVERFGADTLRMYEMFMGPLEQVKPWQTSGCDGIQRFLSRLWRLFIDQDSGETRSFGETTPAVRRALHQAIKETTEGIEALKFNTPISRMMEVVNACKGALPERKDAESLLLILSPYAPHVAEELWNRLGHSESLAYAQWPTWDEQALVEQTIEVAVQVMGKLRGTVQVPRDASREVMLEAAHANENVARWLSDKQIVKEIVVPGRLVNFVVR
jgi:leucyl-tRNA synthetase